MNMLNKRNEMKDNFGPSTTAANRVEEKKVIKENISLKVTSETRAKVNALKSIKSFKNVNELISNLVDKEIDTLDDATKKAIEIIIKSSM